MRRTTVELTVALVLSMGFFSCGEGMSDGERWGSTNGLDNDPPLSAERDVLPYGIPENAAPPPTDDDPPAKGYFLLNEAGKPPMQSQVKSQGSRGVCTIFATAAYMEHLYLKARQVNPALAPRIPVAIDFSEQYLQWSAKFEVGSFPDSSGSNSSFNLRALSQYGVVLENVWPYETSQWSTSNDPKCDGTSAQPTVCYTNGHPSDSAKAAPKYKLPAARYLSARAISKHIYENESAVLIGVKFFYQAWNHRKSRLVTNQGYWQKGYVLYPNADDKTDSSGDRSAGHGILVVGWDNDLEVATVDKDGKATCSDAARTKVDPSGSCPEGSKMVTEKGFYLFKNSWGTGNFGRNSGIGDGYGYISMRYLHEYGDAMVTGVPDKSMIPDAGGGGGEPGAAKRASFSGSVQQDEQQVHEVSLAATATNIEVKMTGTGGDADLYTQLGTQPTVSSGTFNTSTADFETVCRPYKGGSDETCSVKAPSKTTNLFIMVNGYDPGASAYAIEVTWKE